MSRMKNVDFERQYLEHSDGEPEFDAWRALYLVAAAVALAWLVIGRFA